MKKIVLMIGLLLIIMSTEAFAVDPELVVNEFLSQTNTHWRSDETTENGKITITESASIRDHSYRFAIVSIDNDVKQIYFVGWFADMRMINGGEFTEGLNAYNDCFYTCSAFLPHAQEFEEIFSSYGIQQDLLEGRDKIEYPYYYADNYWKLETLNVGRIVANHPGPYRAEAVWLDDGRIWFSVQFP